MKAQSIKNQQAAAVVPVFLVGWLILAVLLATIRPLALPDEGRYGEVGRWMLQSGDWLTPRLNGLPFFHKPPLLYWLDAVAMALFGVHPWVARLVPAVHAWIMLSVTALYARRFLGQGVAARVTVILGSSMLLLGGSDYVNCDMEVACWISVAVWAFAAALQTTAREKFWLSLAGFTAVALGVLSKGLIGVVLPGMALFIWVGIERRWRDLRDVPWWRGWSLTAVITLPWFILLEHKFHGFFHYFFIEQQFTRYVGTGFNNRQPVAFYAVCLGVFMFPFSALLRWRCPESSAAVRSSWHLAWTVLLSILIFFSIPASKLVGYILPVLPAMALLIAIGLPEAVERRSVKLLISAGSVVLGATFAWVGWYGPTQYAWPTGLGVAGGVLALLWWGGAVCIFRRWSVVNLLSGWAVQSIATLVVVDIGVAYQTHHKSAEDLAHYLLQQDKAVQVVYWGTYPFDLPFYLNTRQTAPILSDWQIREKLVKDDAEQQLIDGLQFEVAAGKVLREKSDLQLVAATWPRAWLVTGSNDRLPEQAAYADKRVFGGLAVWRPNGYSSVPH